MKKNLAGLMTCFILLSAPAMAATTDVFIRKAAMGNRFEIDSSSLAGEKATDGAVRAFALQMIADHGALDKDFKSALSKAGLAPPDDAPDARHLEIIAELKAADTAVFDARYVAAQAAAHDETAALFRDYAATGENDALKAFAAQALPVIERHREMVAGLAAGRR